MNFNLILASNSPRRRQLLSELGLEFSVYTKYVDESFPPDLEAEKVAEYLSRKKATAYTKDIKVNDLLITADTTVVVDQLILNKPENAAEAQKMLRILSGRTHQVITGVCLITQDQMVSFSDITTVYFKQLSETEINHYIDKFQPYDKAGSYAIQEWIGMIGIEKIEGSYFNVVGLPVKLVHEQLLLLNDNTGEKN